MNGICGIDIDTILSVFFIVGGLVLGLILWIKENK